MRADGAHDQQITPGYWYCETHRQQTKDGTCCGDVEWVPPIPPPVTDGSAAQFEADEALENVTAIPAAEDEALLEYSDSEHGILGSEP